MAQKNRSAWLKGGQSRQVVTLVRRDNSTVRNRIASLREKYHLSWNDLARKMGYRTKASVIRVWAHPEHNNYRFEQRLQRAQVELKEERNDVYEVVALARLPRRFRVVVRARKCLGHGEWCFFGDPLQKFCNSECEQIYKNRQARSGKLPKKAGT